MLDTPLQNYFFLLHSLFKLFFVISSPRRPLDTHSSPVHKEWHGDNGLPGICPGGASFVLFPEIKDVLTVKVYDGDDDKFIWHIPHITMLYCASQHFEGDFGRIAVSSLEFCKCSQVWIFLGNKARPQHRELLSVLFGRYTLSTPLELKI